MSEALVYLGVSAFAVTVLAILFRLEDSYGDRVLFPRARAFFDQKFVSLQYATRRLSHHSVLEQLRLLWHFFVHSLLKQLLHTISRTQHSTEDMLRKNRNNARLIRLRQSSESHFDTLAQHKKDVALSPQQRAKRKST